MRVPSRPPSAPDLTEVAPSASRADPAARSLSNADWFGTDRYRVIRRLGEGGMGVVYEALDREQGRAVALKRLLNFTAEGLYRFKREFRTLADVYHPNLVRLYELVVSESDRPFFAMELVRGADFVEHVRGHAPQGTAPGDMDRLRRVLRQLVEGVQAIHAAGRLHRDLKPSNVMVGNDERVVVLDFGIATELATAADVKRSDAANIVGTREGMAWTAPLASMIRAATANAEGNARAAATALRVAIESAAATEMNLHMWCARRQLGCLIGGEEGARYVAQADAAMQAEGVRAPARIAMMFLPGQWDGGDRPLLGSRSAKSSEP